MPSSGSTQVEHNAEKADGSKKVKRRTASPTEPLYYESPGGMEEQGLLKHMLTKDQVENREIGVFLKVHGMELICMYNEYIERGKMVPLFKPLGNCHWFPSGAQVEVDFVKWDEVTNSFFCTSGKSEKSSWKRACDNCVFKLFAGDTDLCRTALFGTGAIRTHCNSCKPAKETLDYKWCVQCQRREPVFAWPNSTCKTHCQDCKKKGMAKPTFHVCEIEGCKVRACFGVHGRKTHCLEHKKPYMELAFKTCMRCKTAKATTGRNGRTTHCEGCMTDVLAGVKSATTGKRKSSEDLTSDGPQRKSMKGADSDDNSSVGSNKSASSRKSKRSESSSGSSLTDDSNGEIRTRPDPSPTETPKQKSNEGVNLGVSRTENNTMSADNKLIARLHQQIQREGLANTVNQELVKQALQQTLQQVTDQQLQQGIDMNQALQNAFHQVLSVHQLSPNLGLQSPVLGQLLSQNLISVPQAMSSVGSMPPYMSPNLLPSQSSMQSFSEGGSSGMQPNANGHLSHNQPQ